MACCSSTTVSKLEFIDKNCSSLRPAAPAGHPRPRGARSSETACGPARNHRPAAPAAASARKALAGLRGGQEIAIMASQWVHLDSNQGPAGYEPDALTAELWTRKCPGAGA